MKSGSRTSLVTSANDSPPQRAFVRSTYAEKLSWPWSKSPETVFSDFRRFVETIHSQLPGTWICYISMKPTPLRWSNWRTVQKTNKMIEDYSRSQERVQFIDVSTAMLDAQGKPRHDLFRWDGLHVNAQGYSLWTLIIRPVLLSRFGQTPP
jgi:lysophospholipase L1-like esterase